MSRWVHAYFGLILATGLLIAKCWPAILTPNLFAEDALIHISAALELSPLQAVFMPFNGYYSLFNNLAAAAIVHAPPALWPGLITALCLACTLCCLAIPYGSDSALWRENWQRHALPVITVLTFLRPIHEYLWLNLINLHFFFCLASLLILFSHARTPAASIARQTLLAIASFTSVTTAVLAPFFLVKAVRLRKTTHAKACAISAGIITCGLLVQLVAMLTTAETLQQTRFHGITLTNTLAAVANRQLLPLVLPTSLLHITLPYFTTPTACLLAILAAALPLAYALNRPQRLLSASLLPLLAFMLLAAHGSHDLYLHSMFGNGKYFVVTQTLFTFLLLSVLAKWLSPALAALLSLCPAATDYLIHPYTVYNSSWQTDIAAAQTTGYGPLQILPKTWQYSWCSPAICNAATRHNLNDTLSVNNTPLPKNDAWKPEFTDMAVAQNVSSLTFSFPLPPQALLLHLYVEVPQAYAASMQLSCSSTTGITVDKHVRFTHLQENIFLPLQGTTACTAALNSTQGRHKLRLRAYY